MKVKSEGHHALFRGARAKVGQQEYDSHGGVSGKGVKRGHEGMVQSVEYGERNASAVDHQHPKDSGMQASHSHRGPSGKTMHEREQLGEKGRKQIHEQRHMALANTEGGELTASPSRDANFAQREHHNGKADLRGAVGDAKSMHYEGHEVGQENIRDNLGSERVRGYGEPQGGTTTLPGRPAGKEKVSGLHTQGPSGLPAHEHGASEYSSGARGTAGSHPMTDHLEDETRGTHQLPAHRFAASANVPQEVKEALARTLVRRR
jgi:hypothetical protein